MSDLEQVYLPLPTSLPPQNEANTNNYNNNAYHGSIIEVRNDNAFEYFYSIVRKKNLNEFLLVFPFAYILVLEVNNITLLLVQKSVRSCPEGDAGKPAAVNRWQCPGHWVHRGQC